MVTKLELFSTLGALVRGSLASRCSPPPSAAMLLHLCIEIYLCSIFLAQFSGSFSLPSRTMAYRVPGAMIPRANGIVAPLLPPATLAGVGGGVLFLFVTVLLALVATCLRGKTSPSQRLELKRQNYFG